MSKSRNVLRYLLQGCDLLLLNMSLGVSLAYSANGWSFLNYPYSSFWGVFNICWIILALTPISYNRSRLSYANNLENLKQFYLLIAYHLIFICSFAAFSDLPIANWSFLGITYLIAAIVGFFYRTSVLLILRQIRKKGYNRKTFVVVGHGEVANSMIQYYRLNPGLGYRFKGFYGSDVPSGSVLVLKELIQEGEIDEVYCCLSNVTDTALKEIVEFAENHLIKVKFLIGYKGMLAHNMKLELGQQVPVLSFQNKPLENWKRRSLKRIFDIVFSTAVILCILSWLIPIIALIIAIDSKGPIFFWQRRNGRSNQRFWCLKFRTMVVNKYADSKQATKNDARITRIGAFLRKTSLDELPQFFNVLIGDMSVIGPRPHPILLDEKYKPQINKFVQRHAVKPGITGLAQAKGYRGETQSLQIMKNRVRLDLFYVERWSLLLDFKIIWLTVISLVRGDKNAY